MANNSPCRTGLKFLVYLPTIKLRGTEKLRCLGLAFFSMKADNTPLSEMEVIQKIHLIKMVKSHGPDGPLPPFFRYDGEVLTSELTKLQGSICAR